MCVGGGGGEGEGEGRESKDCSATSVSTIRSMLLYTL